MEETTGVVSETSRKDKQFGIKVNGTWYSGFVNKDFDPKKLEGRNVKFKYVQNGKYKNVKPEDILPDPFENGDTQVAYKSEDLEMDGDHHAQVITPNGSKPWDGTTKVWDSRTGKDKDIILQCCLKAATEIYSRLHPGGTSEHLPTPKEVADYTKALHKELFE